MSRIRRRAIEVVLAVMALVGFEHFVSGLSWDRTAIITVAGVGGTAIGISIRQSSRRSSAVEDKH
jgi:hypothetical protein